MMLQSGTCLGIAALLQNPEGYNYCAARFPATNLTPAAPEARSLETLFPYVLYILILNLD